MNDRNKTWWIVALSIACTVQLFGLYFMMWAEEENSKVVAHCVRAFP